MTPQEWIEKSKKPIWADTPFDGEDIAVHKQAFVEEGAQHIRAALAVISQLREKVAAAEEFAENMRRNRDEVLRTSTQQAQDSARLRIVVQNVYAMIANEVRR